mgnify:CR=1 FL=1
MMLPPANGQAVVASHSRTLLLEAKFMLLPSAILAPISIRYWWVNVRDLANLRTMPVPLVTIMMASARILGEAPFCLAIKTHGRMINAVIAMLNGHP